MKVTHAIGAGLYGQEFKEEGFFLHQKLEKLHVIPVESYKKKLLHQNLKKKIQPIAQQT